VTEHFIDKHLNFRRLFAEAIQDSIRDYYQQPAHRALIEPGFYSIRLGRGRALVAARIWWCNHEPGVPENTLDRWPIPFLAGEILGEWCDPAMIWVGRDRCPLVPTFPLTTVEQEYAYQCGLSAWAKDYARDEPIARPRRPVDLTALPPIPPPSNKRD
jgi:hypothetical protein